jgi:serine/threonine protein kinase
VRALFSRGSRAKPPALFPRTLSHYDLLNKIGSGTEGAVYQARDRRSGQCVAVKILRPYADPESRLRFRREADCAFALAPHPNIAAVYQFIHTRRTESIVLEYVPGRTLDRLIPERGLSLETGLDYARQIAAALGAIHSAKMIHRDLKPANFVVTKNGIVKLLDFGAGENDRWKAPESAAAGAPGAARNSRRHNPGHGGLHGPGTGSGRSSGSALGRVQLRSRLL